MRRVLHRTPYTRPRNDVFEEDEVMITLGASHNMSPLNNRGIVVTCFSSPQDHCVTRGFMEECAPTLNAAAGMSGNNRPFIVKECFPINSMVLGKEGGHGDRQTFGIGADGEPCPTLQTGHNHACAIVKKKAYGIDQQGGKGGANYTEDVAPTICSDSHGTPHGVCLVGGDE